MRQDQIESEKQQEARKADEQRLARAAVDLHCINIPCGVLVCPVCKFRRLHYSVSIQGKAWISCMTASCVEVIDL